MDVMADVEGLIARFEDAAVGRGDLTAAFDALAAAAGGSAAILFCPAEGRAGITGSAIAATVQRAYVEFSWGETDVLTVGARRLNAGEVVFTQDFIPIQMVESNRFFTEFLERFDMMWAAGWAFMIEDELWCLGVTRGRAQGPFDEPDKALLHAVAPRISRSLQLLTRSLALYGRGICASLDVRQRPYVTLNHLGLVDHIAPSAEPMLAVGPLSVRGGRLFSADAETNERLEQIALSARVGVRGSENLGLSPALEFVAPRVEGRPVIVTAHRMFGHDPYDILPGAQYILRLMDVSHQPMAREEPIRLLFDLSPREIEIAQRLSQGEDPGVIAAALGLKTTYVRQVVKSVLAKTNLNRVHQLVALLARFPDEA